MNHSIWQWEEFICLCVLTASFVFFSTMGLPCNFQSYIGFYGPCYFEQNQVCDRQKERR